MPNPKLETYKNKETGTVYDYTDAAAQAALAGILNGTDIDSFGDVETALATKVDKVPGKGLSTNDYDNTAKGIVTTAQDNIKANTKLIKDTVGWSGKNILNTRIRTYTHNGITYTVLSDKKVHAEGTATARSFINLAVDNTDIPTGDYIMSGTPSGGSSSTYYMRIQSVPDSQSSHHDDYGSGVSFNIASTQSSAIYICVENGVTIDKVFEPMIRKATILDPTYEPYHESVAKTMFLRSEQAVLGAKNLFDINLYGSSYEVNGITFAIQTDGQIKCTGTATATPTTTQFSQFLKAGKYILSGCPANGSDSSYRVDLQNVAGVIDYGEGVIFTLATDTTVNVRVRFASGYECPTNGLIFEPMIRLASDPDDTYAPYAMTNRELTELKLNKLPIEVKGISVDDLNEAGIYYCNGNMTGLPFGSLGIMIVLKSPVNQGIQQIWLSSGDVSKFYTRRFWDNAWSGWYVFTGTVVS